MSIILCFIMYIHLQRHIHSKNFYDHYVPSKSFVYHCLKTVTQIWTRLSLITPLTAFPIQSYVLLNRAALPTSWTHTLSQLETENQNYFSQNFKILISLSAYFKISLFFFETCRLKRRKKPNYQGNTASSAENSQRK